MSDTADDEEELEGLLLYAEDLSGWVHWESSSDPRRKVFKDFLRHAIRPLQRKIRELEEEIEGLRRQVEKEETHGIPEGT